MHEASLYEDNCFVTLTYADDHLPAYGSLVKRDFQLFMKRLRAAIAPRRVRFFHCGEYGTMTGRPHYHVLLFGFDFTDKVPWRVRNGLPVWRSPLLEELWTYGNSEIGSVTFESAAYVARYVVKKVTGERAAEHYARVDGDTGEVIMIEPEYCTMSRRPGIGGDWIGRFAQEVFPSDSVVVRGALCRPPRYYGSSFEVVDPVAWRRVQVARRKAAKPSEHTPERLAVREACAAARLNLLPREGV